jgi:hypothetical protein
VVRVSGAVAPPSGSGDHRAGVHVCYWERGRREERNFGKMKVFCRFPTFISRWILCVPPYRNLMHPQCIWPLIVHQAAHISPLLDQIWIAWSESNGYDQILICCFAHHPLLRAPPADYFVWELTVFFCRFGFGLGPAFC